MTRERSTIVKLIAATFGIAGKAKTWRGCDAALKRKFTVDMVE